MKRIFSIMILVIMAFTLTSCGEDKTAIKGDKFKKIMTASKYTVTKVTKQYEDIADEAYTASKDGYTVEFYKYKETQTAIDTYNTKKALYANIVITADSEKETSGGNYKRYMIKTADKYTVVSRIGNTLVYVSANIKYESNVKSVLNKLGY